MRRFRKTKFHSLDKMLRNFYVALLLWRIDCVVESTKDAPAVKIYTDGSKVDELVGASVSLWKNGAEFETFKLKLSSCCSVYQAELVALLKATQRILCHPETTYGVYSDSRSALESVAGGRSFNPLVVEIRKNINKAHLLNKKIDIFWVKAHSGMEGNERADQLAKEAAHLEEAPVYNRFPISHLKNCLRGNTIEKWNHRYRDGETAAITKLFLPNVASAFSIIKQMKPTGLITQMLTGHGGFLSYLHRFRVRQSAACPCDDAAEETVLHVLTDCPMYGYDRYNAEQAMGMRVTETSLKGIMLNVRLRGIFLGFAVRVMQGVVKRNR